MPGGKAPVSSSSSKIRCEGRGSRSEGLRMKALPVASAKGRNQSGIIAGKLNGVIAATTPTGWRTISTSTPPRDALERLALQQVGDRGGGLDRLDPAADLAVGVGERLAHVGGDERGDLGAVLDERLAQGEHGAGALLRRRLRPARLRLGGCADGGVDVGGGGARDERGELAGGGVAILDRSLARRLDPGAGDVVPERPCLRADRHGWRLQLARARG